MSTQRQSAANANLHHGRMGLPATAYPEHAEGGKTVQPMDSDEHPCAEALAELTTRMAAAAAQSPDLHRFRRLVYIGGEGEVLAAFLHAWQQLSGIWLGPADRQAAASRFLAESQLADRMRYVAGESLAAIPAGDLVVLNAVDAAVDQSLELLASAGAGWLPPEGRWLMLQRESPHLSCVIGPSLLHAQGLRMVSRWALPAGVQMLACAPEHRFIENLGNRAATAVAAVAATALLGITTALFAARAEWAGPRVADPAAALQAVPAAELQHPITGQFQRHALNALLVPLLDDADPPRWTDVALRYLCGPATRVEIDGQPLVPGATIPAVPFTVRWHIDQCWPLDYAAMELSGRVDLRVHPEGAGLSAIVNAQHLRIATAKGSGSVDAPFAAAMALGGSGSAVAQ